MKNQFKKDNGFTGLQERLFHSGPGFIQDNAERHILYIVAIHARVSESQIYVVYCLKCTLMVSNVLHNPDDDKCEK